MNSWLSVGCKVRIRSGQSKVRMGIGNLGVIGVTIELWTMGIEESARCEPR